jgi:hypothetical protein
MMHRDLRVAAGVLVASLAAGCGASFPSDAPAWQRAARIQRPLPLLLRRHHHMGDRYASCATVRLVVREFARDGVPDATMARTPFEAGSVMAWTDEVTGWFPNGDLAVERRTVETHLGVAMGDVHGSVSLPPPLPTAMRFDVRNRTIAPADPRTRVERIDTEQDSASVRVRVTTADIVDVPYPQEPVDVAPPWMRTEVRSVRDPVAGIEEVVRLEQHWSVRGGEFVDGVPWIHLRVSGFVRQRTTGDRWVGVAEGPVEGGVRVDARDGYGRLWWYERVAVVRVDGEREGRHHTWGLRTRVLYEGATVPMPPLGIDAMPAGASAPIRPCRAMLERALGSGGEPAVPPIAPASTTT